MTEERGSLSFCNDNKGKQSTVTIERSLVGIIQPQDTMAISFSQM